MLTHNDLIKLSEAYHHGPDAVESTMAALGDPPAQAIVDAALAGMAHNDRNVRVAMLWTLGRYPTGTVPDDLAADGILTGLRDPERRVREVAMKCAQPFLADPRVPTALVEIATSPDEKRKLQSLALDALCGQVGGRAAEALPAEAVATLASLVHDDGFRHAVIERLVRAELTPEVRRLLEDVVHSGAGTGDDDVAALAARALGGEVVVNLGSIDDPEARTALATTHDPAYGRVYFWTERRESVVSDVAGA
jgi:hypothetical protein